MLTVSLNSISESIADIFHPICTVCKSVFKSSVLPSAPVSEHNLSSCTCFFSSGYCLWVHRAMWMSTASLEVLPNIEKVPFLLQVNGTYCVLLCSALTDDFDTKLFFFLFPWQYSPNWGSSVALASKCNWISYILINQILSSSSKTIRCLQSVSANNLYGINYHICICGSQIKCPSHFKF